MRGFFDWKRGLLAAPLVALALASAWWLSRDGTGADTPRAMLVDTPAGASDDVGVREGQLARDFAVTSPAGEPVRLSELRGRPTIVNFWATWCSSCLAELPDFKDVQEEYGADRLNVLAVNAGEGADTARSFIDELAADEFRWGSDPTLVVADSYGVFGLPTSIFIDADGFVRGIYTGHLTADDMRSFVSASFEGKVAADPAPRLRLVTTVARDRTLDVIERRDGRVELRSKSLRCDDSYCAGAAIDELASMRDVTEIDRATGEDPPRVVVAFDAAATDARSVAAALAEELERLGDPLYERPLEIRYE
jgi:thiol-disulfide isomerase/thioredoxin